MLLRSYCLALSTSLSKGHIDDINFWCTPKKLITLFLCLQCGPHLDSCVFLGSDSSYSALADDHVYLEELVESPQSRSLRGSVDEGLRENNAVNNSTELIIELQVKYCFS